MGRAGGLSELRDGGGSPMEGVEEGDANALSDLYVLRRALRSRSRESSAEFPWRKVGLLLLQSVPIGYSRCSRTLLCAPGFQGEGGGTTVRERLNAELSCLRPTSSNTAVENNTCNAKSITVIRGKFSVG